LELPDEVQDRFIELIKYGNMTWDLSDLDHPEIVKHLTIYADLICEASLIRDIRIDEEAGQLCLTALRTAKKHGEDDELELRFSIKPWPLDPRKKEAQLEEYEIFNVERVNGNVVKTLAETKAEHETPFFVKVENLPDIPQLPEQHTIKFSFVPTTYEKVRPYLDSPKRATKKVSRSRKKRKPRVTVYGGFRAGKEEEKRIKKSFDRAVLERCLGKNYYRAIALAPELPIGKQELVDFVRDWTRSTYARYVCESTEPLSIKIEAFRSSDRLKFTVLPFFNFEGEIRRLWVNYFRDPARQLCEMSDPELREHRDRHIRSMEDQVDRLEKELQTIDEELQRRGLGTE